MESTYARNGLWGLGSVLALGLITSVYLITSTVHVLVTKSGKITVKGYAEQRITSDYVSWQGSITTRAKTLAEAYDKLEKDLTLVKDYFKGQGVSQQELNISATKTSTFHKYTDKGIQTSDIEGYALQQDFHIHSPNIDLVKTIAENATSLIKDGLEISSSSPQYIYTKIDNLKIRMLGEAAKDALARAQQLATNSGSQVGSLKSAQQGVFQITPAFSTTVSDYGENDTSSIEKSIKAVITMEYIIN